MAAPKSIAQSFIEALARRNIDQVFANSGTDHAPIVEALTAMKQRGLAVPHFHVIPHENLAMAMAQGYYRASGKPAVVLVHVGVGTANTVCSLMNAHRTNVPVLLVAGHNPLSQEGHAGSRSVPIHWGQDAFDQNALVREYTKWEHELRAYQSIDALIDRAIVIAMSEPRGPVYLTLPRELLADPDRTEPAEPTPIPGPPAPDQQQISDLATAIAAAEKPAIVTSTLGVDAEARKVLEDLSDRFAIPVLQSWPFAVNIRSAHPMNMRLEGADWLAEADVVLTVDAAVPWVPRRLKPRADASIFHLSVDPAYTMYPYRDFPASRLIAGSSKAGLSMLANALAQVTPEQKRIEQRRQEISAKVNTDSEKRQSAISMAKQEKPVNAAWTAQCVNAIKNASSVIVNELGIPFACIEFEGDEIFIGETTAGALGSGIGCGLGAKLADPDRNVICCVGDGSFMFGNPTPALLVSKVLDIPILIIVANNGMWYAVEQSTVDVYPDGEAADTANVPLTQFGYSPDYAAIADACGAHGETVTDPADLEDALRRGLEKNRSGQAAVIDVVTAPGTR
jgi:acetolactate synthase-1/2/3 large subunit